MNSEEYLLSTKVEDLIWYYEREIVSKDEFIVKLRNIISNYE